LTPLSGFTVPVGLRTFGVEWVDDHAGFQQLLDGGALTGLDRKRDQPVGLQPLPELFPTQRGVFDLEVFDDPTLGVDDHDGMALTGENPVRQKPDGLTNLLLRALRGS
jgi:hypothetical protein